ncbi:tyrosine-type recombinase/integrase [Moritella marina ATCC 15381]|uniref:Tyrosine-type recombinase/integrase n=1 Tax=Moritella marina ATCC 15381 TaxID=1202962 RepID=A0A5J6WP39_MORMI|nr:VPA1269 family protein [Moritella marina]QFI39916.1 tyrosine-type recombinase/integrase [Moritella marina ATCC 15381]
MYKTLLEIRNAIEIINRDVDEILITGYTSYSKNYRRDNLLPSRINHVCTHSERSKFIAEYASEIKVEQGGVNLWDALLRRKVVDITLEYVRDEIELINSNASEVLITGSSTYVKHYQRAKFLPRNITEVFTHSERSEFIAEYANEMKVEQGSVNLWDALLRRPTINITLEYVRDEIEIINSNVSEVLITSSVSYSKNCQYGRFLPRSIPKFFTGSKQAEFIAEYANEMNVNKRSVGLWDALLRRQVADVTLEYVRNGIEIINSEACEALISNSASYAENYHRNKFFPSTIVQFFTGKEQAEFIAEYANEMNVFKESVNVWDALLRRPVMDVTLKYVRDGIEIINSGAGEDLITGVSTYTENYQRVKFLPGSINHFFSDFEKTNFIAEYANALNVDKGSVNLWDALLRRPVVDVTLKYIRDEIEIINNEADELLIIGHDSYIENYQRAKFLPSTIPLGLKKLEQAEFIAEYANEMNVNKNKVGLWDALLRRPIADVTLEYVRDGIETINNDAGEVLITASSSYAKNYHRNEFFPSTLTQFFTDSEQAEFIAGYANEMNIDKENVSLWDALCPQRKVKYTLEMIKKSHPKWFLYFSSFMANQNNISQKERVFKNFIQYFIDEFGYSLNPLVCLSQKEKKIDLNEYESFFSSFGESSKKIFHTIVVEFIDFIIADLSGFDNDTEEDEAPLLSNKFNYFESDLLHIKSPKFSESNKPRLAFSYIVKAREWIFPDSCNNFTDLKHLHSLVDQDWIEVEESQINALDLNCVWRHRKKDNKTSRKKDINSGRSVEFVYEIWMPTRWIMLYTLLQVPIRGVQVTKLDSGEADSYLPVINNGEMEWINNPSKLNSGVKESFIKRYPGDHAGMYVTTNKTSSSQGGYAVPYIPFDLCKWIIQFREFQSTYNPLDKPTLWTEIKLRRKTNTKKLKSMGSQCFLFREMGDVTPMNEAVFKNAFAFVLAQIETKDLKLTKKLNDKNTLNSYETVYTPHSLRVSLISAYITDGKIPIEVVSKIVGHHSLMMTIYYTKIGGGQFRHYLEQAEKNMLKASGDNLALELLEKQLERADENLICNTKGGVEQFTTNWPTSSYFISDIGICPMAGTGCNEGGKIIESTKTRLLYAPVPQGYLGERNCPRCRFFMTGVGYIPGLAAVMHRIQTECGSLNEKQKEYTIDVKILEDEAYDCELEDIPFTKRLELAKSIQNKEAYATRLNAHKDDIVAIARLVEMSKSLVNKSNSKNKLALVINNSIGEIGIEYNDSSEFELFDTVCQDSEIYSIVDAANVTPRRTQLIDAMLQANNVSSALFKIPVQEQLKIGNQVTQLLLKRLGSWDKLNSVAEGRTRLNENSASVVNSSSMKSITKEVQLLIDNAKCSGLQLATSTATNDDNVIDVKEIK